MIMKKVAKSVKRWPLYSYLHKKVAKPENVTKPGNVAFVLIFRASPEGRIGVSSYTWEGCHLGGIKRIPWPGS